MKIVCAPDSFKGTFTAPEAAAAMAAGVRRVAPNADVVELPVADGGEGTTRTLVAALGGEMRSAKVTGPRGETVDAEFGVIQKPTDAIRGMLGVVELAAASGLELLSEDQRDPTLTTSYGTGELILAAIDAGCDEIIVGIGGSAVCDGGTGLAQALGVQFFDQKNVLITKPLAGFAIFDITRIEKTPSRARLRIAYDVTNPLTGPDGSAAVYGPQKGATPQQVEQLDAALEHLERITGVSGDFPGAGAAGGTGYGLVVFCGATLERGIDLVLDALDFDEHLRDADLVLAGEGRLDRSSLFGKATVEIARRAATYDVPTVAVVGEHDPAFDADVFHAMCECGRDITGAVESYLKKV